MANDEKTVLMESTPLSESSGEKQPHNRFQSVLKRLADMLTIEPDSPVSAETASLGATTPDTEPAAPSAQSEHWWLYLIGLLAGTILIVSLPLPYSVIVLISLIIAALFLAARDADITWRSGLSSVGVLARKGRQLIRQTPAFVASHRQQLTITFGLAACVFLIMSAVEFRPTGEPHSLNRAFQWMLLGGMALGIAIYVAPGLPTLSHITDLALTPINSNWLLTVLGVLLLALLAEINAKVFSIPSLANVSYHLQFLLLCGGITLVTLGLSGTSRLSGWRTVRSKIRWGEVVPVLLLVLLALILRLWQLDTTMRGSVDEAVAINGIFHAWGHNPPGLVSPPSVYMSTPLFSYWQAHLVNLLGHSLFSLRVTSAIVGALTVVAVYLLGSALFDRKTALIAALLLATFPPHIHFSRISLLHIADPLFGTLTLAFLARGLKFNRRADWALAGVSLGLTQYFFEAGRLLFPLLVAVCVVLIALTSRRHLWAQRRGLVVMALAALFVAAPVYYSIAALEQPRAARLGESGVSASHWQQLLEGGVSQQEITELLQRVLIPFQVYVHLPDTDVYYGGQQALVLEYLVPLFLLGVFYLLWRFRAPAMILLLWIVATALGNSLLRDSAVYARYVVVLPALPLILAAAIRYVPPLVWQAKNRALLGALMVILVIFIGAAQVNYYFGRHLPQFEVELRNAKPYRDGIDAVLRAVTLPANTQLILISSPVSDPNVAKTFLGFLLENPKDMTLIAMPTEQVTREYVAGLPHDKNYAFFVALDAPDTVKLLEEFFQLEPPQTSPFDITMDKAFILYFAPQATATTMRLSMLDLQG